MKVIGFVERHKLPAISEAKPNSVFESGMDLLKRRFCRVDSQGQWPASICDQGVGGVVT
jgi:hypothetical protein